MDLVNTLRRRWRSIFKDRRIAWLELSGVIAEQRSISSAPQFLEHLDEVEKREFKALILRINSPGGTVGTTQDIYDRLVWLREEKGLKVVASLGDTAASGGIYAAMAADRVIAHGGTVTGSIGVIIKAGNFRELFDKIGIHSDVVKAGRFKDILSMERSLTDEERALLQDTVDDTYRQFVETVSLARGLDVSTVETFADGRIFSGRQALAYGLVDAVGGINTAIDVAKDLAGMPRAVSPHLVRLQKRKSVIARVLTGDTRMAGLMPDGLNRRLEAGEMLAGIPLWLMPRSGL